MKLKYQHISLVSPETTALLREQLGEYRAYLERIAAGGTYEQDESSIVLSSDDALAQEAYRIVDTKRTKNLKYVVVIGIGGSNLSTKAIYDAKVGFFDAYEPDRFPKMLFAETSDAAHIRALTSFLEKTVEDLGELVVISISKSGGTTETIANTEVLLNRLSQRFGNSILERLIVITDDGSPYAKEASKKGIAIAKIPLKVGGRYSALSPVGLIPLALAKFDTEALRKGAREMRERCILSADEENYAMMSASVLFAQSRDGKTINDNFIFNGQLESAGKWYRQLLAESIGKEKDSKDNVVHAGITPTVSIGSTDLHSVGQLYLGGPRDKMTTFIYTEPQDDIFIPTDRIFPSIVTMLNGKKLEDVTRAILEGTKAAYRKSALPFMEIVLDHTHEYELGAFMQFKMVEMMYLGKLFNVNAFDQPNVESYKIETKSILEGE